MPELNFDELLAPISDENPCGVDLEADDSPTGPHWEILRTRREAKAAEDDNDGQAESIWRKLESICLKTLSSQSKDLRYVAFLVEARLRTTGLSGVCEGIELFQKLVETFGADLFPRPDETGFENTVFPMIQLDSLLDKQLRMVPVTASKQHAYEFWQLQNAQTLERASVEEREAAKGRGVAVIEEVTQSAAETPVEHFESLLKSITACREAILAANDSVQQAYEQRLTSFSKIRVVLDELESAVKFLAGSRISVEDAGDAEADDSEQVEAAGTEAPTTQVSGQIRSRQDAFHQLTKIASYFEASEPQSFIPTQIRRIIRWGTMSPDELFREVIEDDHARSNFFRLVGIVEQNDD